MYVERSATLWSLCNWWIRRLTQITSYALVQYLIKLSMIWKGFLLITTLYLFFLFKYNASTWKMKIHSEYNYTTNHTNYNNSENSVPHIKIKYVPLSPAFVNFVYSTTNNKHQTWYKKMLKSKSIVVLINQGHQGNGWLPIGAMPLPYPVSSYPNMPTCKISQEIPQINDSKCSTVKPVYNDHLYHKIYYLWLIQ